jgi:hypothetical protein
MPALTALSMPQPSRNCNNSFTSFSIETIGIGLLWKNSLTKPETAGLDFDSVEDLVDFNCEGSEHGEGLCIFNDSSKDYEKLKIEVALALRSDFFGEEFHLIFCAIPSVASGHTNVPNGTLHINANNLGNAYAGDNERVFIAVTCLVECNEQIIPSLVRLERAKERPKLYRDVSGALQLIFESGRSTGKWEVGMFNSFAARRSSDCYSIDSMVESRTEIVHGISGDHGELLRDGPAQAHLLHDVLRLVRVRLGKGLEGGLFQEFADFLFKVTDMFPTPSEFEVRTIEWAGHQRDFSNPMPLFARLRMTPKAQPNPSHPQFVSYASGHCWGQKRVR